MNGIAVRAAATLVGVTFMLPLWVAAAPGEAAAPVCPGSGNHAGVVVRHDTGAAVAGCAGFGGSASGAEQVLTASGIEYQVANYPGYGDAVCEADGQPNTPAGGWNTSNCLGGSYWGIFISRRLGAWGFAHTGVSGITLADGDCLGLSWVPSGAKPNPPPGPQELCPAPQPQASPTPGGQPAPGVGAGGGTGGRQAGGGASVGSAGTAAAGSSGPAGSQAVAPGRDGAGPVGPRQSTGDSAAPHRSVAPVTVMPPATLPALLAAAAVAAGMTVLALFRAAFRATRTVNARAVGTWSAAATIIVVAGDNPVYRVLVALAALNLLMVWRRPGRSLRGLLVIVAGAAVFSISLNVLLSHGGQHVVTRLPNWLPGIGGNLSLEAGAFGAGIATGVVAAALAVAPLSLALETHQLVDALPGVLQRTGAALAGSLNLVPAVARSFVSVREGQRMRGVTSARGTAHAVLVPVLLTAMESSVQLSEAMEARAFGSGPRTRYRGDTWGWQDWVVVACAMAAAAGFLAARATGLAEDWYPFPGITAPRASMLVLAVPVLLVVPTLLPRRGTDVDEGQR